MPVAIRLSRVGAKHVPFFRMVVVDSRKKRDGAVIEVLGTYDALKTKLVQFKPERFDEWVKKGAQPSDSAKKIYKLYQLQQAGKLPEAKEKPQLTKPAVKKEKPVEAKPEVKEEVVVETKVEKVAAPETTPEKTQETKTEQPEESTDKE